MTTPLKLFRTAVWRNRSGVALLAGLIGLQVLTIVSLPWPLKLLVDHVLLGDPWPAPLEPVVGLLGGSDTLVIGALTAALLALFVAQSGFTLLSATVSADVAARMRSDLAAQLLDRLQRLDLGFHSRSRVGDLTQRVVEDTRFPAELLQGVLMPALQAVGTLVAMLGILIAMSPELALITLVTSLPVILLVRYFKEIIAERAYVQQKSRGALMSIAEQSISSLQMVQAFGAETQGDMRFRDQTTVANEAQRHTTRAQLAFNLSVGTLQAIGTGAALMVGGLLVLNGSVTVGTLVLALAYVKSVFAPVQTLAGISTAYGRAMGKARRVIETMEETPRIAEAPDARPLPTAGPDGRGIAFENVSYRYRTGAPDVLDGVNLEIAPGETVVLIGETGAGKSTLAALLMRFADPDSGRVTMDGVDLRDITLESLRGSLSVVLQDTFLLPVSVLENLRIARPDASRAAIEDAARRAQAHAFIEALPEGYDTRLYEGGAGLSGGQKQRLAIARAILRDAPVVIFDEPSSALDSETEAALFKAIDDWRRNKTMLVIAHRPSTLRIADRVVELRDGRLVARSMSDSAVRA